jgi:hypothetical protein
MAINRRFLYAGLFLVALGGVLVAVDLSAVDTSALAGALRLWPVALVAIGVGIVARRSRYALVAGMIASLLPGLVLGGGLAIAPEYASECGTRSNVGHNVTDQGDLADGAEVSVDVECGSLALDTRPGTGWSMTSRTTGGRAPAVEATAQGLSVSTTGGDNWLDADREQLELRLPSSRITNLGVRLAAGRSTLDLDGANIAHLDVTGSAADVFVDANGAAVETMSAKLELGRLSIQLPQQGQYTGSFRASAGELRICIPFFLGVHVDLSGSPREVRINGLEANGSVWENEAYASAENRADLDVKVNFGSVVINPIGGCK